MTLRLLLSVVLGLSVSATSWVQAAATATAPAPKSTKPVKSADQFFDSACVKIHFIDSGANTADGDESADEEPVILVHGFTANIDFNWRMPGIYSALDDDYRVIALDNRGHGLSDKPHEPEKYGVEMCEDVVRLMDHLKLEQAHVVGYSMGGFITSKLLTLHPQRVRSAVLGGAGWSRNDDSVLMSTLDELADSLESGKGIGPLIKRLSPAGQEVPSDEQIDNMSAMVMLGNDSKALAAVARGMKTLGVTEEQLRANTVPTLALIGEIDPLKQGVDAMQGVMQHLETVVVEGGDHMSAVTDPMFVASLKAFLAKHSEPVAEAGPAAN